MERVTGLELGPPRLPLKPCVEQERKAVFEELKTLGFFEFVR